MEPAVAPGGTWPPLLSILLGVLPAQRRRSLGRRFLGNPGNMEFALWLAGAHRRDFCRRAMARGFTLWLERDRFCTWCYGVGMLAEEGVPALLTDVFRCLESGQRGRLVWRGRGAPPRMLILHKRDL